MFKDLSKEDAHALLKKTFTPAKPISRREVLYGRDSVLRKIDRAFRSDGKHIFIFGDRGVGKTSLAVTVAYENQPASQELVLVSCSSNAGFGELIQDAAAQLLPHATMTRDISTGKSASLDLKIASGSISQTIKKGIIPPIHSVNDASQLFKEITKERQDYAVVVFDEFDQLADVTTKKLFADLIKNISDREIAVKFIFCGIGDSLEELIGLHLSTDRYIAPIELSAISLDARWDILRGGLEPFGVTIDRQMLIRVGNMSDGFPYYVHLFGEHLVDVILEDEDIVEDVSFYHFDEALRHAVAEADTSLKQRYELVTRKTKHSDTYERALWSVAAERSYERPIRGIYMSYEKISEELGEQTVASTTFYQIIAKLKSDNHGAIIEMKSHGWYRFKENIIRGYVRMKAAEHGLDFGVDHNFDEQWIAH